MSAAPVQLVVESTLLVSNKLNGKLTSATREVEWGRGGLPVQQ